jgi:predicted ATPase
LQRKAVNALQTLTRHYLARQQFAELESYTPRLLQIDALDEDALRLQMQALALRGERNQALKRYQGFRDKLLAELDVEPAPETVKLARAIQSGQTSRLKLQKFQRSDRLLTFQMVSASALPNTLVPFVDREVESKEIARYLASQDCRLITLVGPGSIGKSRLAMRAAADDGPGWTDGAWIVSLDGVAASYLETTLANALGIATHRHSRVRAQLYDHLREKELLIVLDNFERLMDRTDLVKSLLDYAPYLKVMVTSREQLGIRGEQVILVAGLDYPDDNDLGSLSEEEIEGWTQQYSAVQLFVENARRVRPGFMLSSDNLPAIVRIYQLVDGLPLAIELASAWVRVFSCDEIWARLEHDLDFLRRRTSDVPERHASMRAVFEYSWEMLPEEARAIVAKLSVFRGGFTLDAAEKITGATPRHMAMLSDKSLLRCPDANRLELYPPLRQYAREKLVQNPNLAGEVAQRHSTYYLAFAAKQAQVLNGKPNAACLEIQRERSNIDAAWQCRYQRSVGGSHSRPARPGALR